MRTLFHCLLASVNERLLFTSFPEVICLLLMPAFKIFIKYLMLSSFTMMGNRVLFLLALLKARIYVLYQFWKVISQIWINYSTHVAPLLATLQCLTHLLTVLLLGPATIWPLHMSIIKFPYLCARKASSLKLVILFLVHNSA